MVRMRDGAELAAFVRRPADPAGGVPAILIHTPYDKENARELWFVDTSKEPLFASNDYAFVVADWRGRFGSREAELRDNYQYGEDGYDLVEWIAAQPWCDGRIGTFGVSALGRVQYWTATERPPHLKAAVPIFAHLNQWYENYYPGGVLRREYVTALGLLFGANSVIEDHPYWDLLWAFVERQYSAELIEVPMLVVSGWYDLYNRGTHRSFADLRALSNPSVCDDHRLLIGEWSHFAVGGESIWGRDFTEEELRWFDADRRIQSDALFFFDFHLRDIVNQAAEWASVRYLQGATGIWRTAEEWPPPSMPLTLYLTSNGGLDRVPPTGGEMTFAYDPGNPSPTVGGQTLGWESLHGPVDQGPVFEHGEAVAFVTEVLDAPLAIAGSIEVSLEITTTGFDTDFAVRLTDVDRNGRHLLLTDGIRRLKLRDDLSRVSEVVPGEEYTVPITLTNELAYTFAEGHRAGLIVSSSNYSRFARNPNTGGDFYGDGEDSEEVINTVVTDGLSSLRLPLIRYAAPRFHRPSRRVSPVDN